MQSQVHLMCGMIASGKSTYAVNAARAGFVVVNDDSLVTSVHGGDYGLYDKKLKPLYKSAGVNLLTHAVALNRPVVIDTGSRSRSARSRWVALAQSLDVPIYALRFPVETPEAHARRRNDADSRGYTYEKWLEVALRHFEEYEPIADDERFDNVIDADWDKIKSGWVFDPKGVEQ